MVDSYRAGRQPGHPATRSPGNTVTSLQRATLCEICRGGIKLQISNAYIEYISLNPHKAKQHYCSAFQSLSPYEPGVPLTYNLE